MTHVWCLVSSRHARSVLERGGPPPLLRTCMQVKVISAQQTFRHLLRDVLKPLRFLRYLLLKLSSMHSTEGTNANEPLRWNPTRRSAEQKRRSTGALQNARANSDCFRIHEGSLLDLVIVARQPRRACASSCSQLHSRSSFSRTSTLIRVSSAGSNFLVSGRRCAKR